MHISKYIDYVASEGDMFASAAEHGELGVPIVACPGWDMRELVRHLGMIHLWAAANVAFPEPDWLNVKDLPDLARYWPTLAAAYPEDADPVDWYRATLTNLIEVLRSAPTDLECFSFLPAPTPLTMWARRQASEIAIHRFDAQSARGLSSHFDPPFATDMLDELLSGFAVLFGTIDMQQPEVIHVHADDTDDHWYVALGPECTQTSREGDNANLTLAGTAADLYVTLWNRTPDTNVAMSGNNDLMDVWRANFRGRWS